MSTMAAATVRLAAKLVESTVRTVPPGVAIGGSVDGRKLNGCGTGPLPAKRSAASGPGTGAGKMYRSFFGRSRKAASGRPKFLASTGRGVRANQSVMRNVESSEKPPSSNTRRNSHPSSPTPWIECGMPPGKYHRSPAETSSANVRPASSTAVMRAVPASMYDHSACLCQCISRTPPRASRMLTPASCLAIGSSRSVTCRAHPPGSRRTWASAKLNRRFGSVPWSVGGGASTSGFSAARAGLTGPRTDAPSPLRTGSGAMWTLLRRPR